MPEDKLTVGSLFSGILEDLNTAWKGQGISGRYGIAR